MKSYQERLEALPRPLLIAIGIILVGIIGLLDYVTGSQLSFSIFFLIPIMLTTRYGGLRTGIFISVLCAAAWLAADLGTNNDYSHPLLPIWNSLVRLGIFLIVTILVARLQDNIEKEWTAARIDSLTGLFNSRYFIETATREMEGSRRYNRPLCLVFMDIDGFKNINDTFGHSEGDKLLQVVADVLKNNIRTTDILARLGGDEFTIMLAETDEAVSRVLLERIKEGLLEAVTVRGWSVSFSFGVAAFESMPSSFDELLGHADGLMYQAKKEGKGGAVSENSANTVYIDICKYINYNLGRGSHDHEYKKRYKYEQPRRRVLL